MKPGVGINTETRKSSSLFKKYFRKYAKFVNGKNHLWVACGYLALAILITFSFIYFPFMKTTHPLLILGLNIFMLAIPILVVAANIINFQTTISSAKGIVSLYLQIVLMFGVIYYLGTAGNKLKEINHSDSDTSNINASLNGVNTDWIKSAISQNKPKSEIFQEALICFHDCIHFSLITSATVGYGNIVPANQMAKMLVNIQVLVSCFLIAFGVGGLFNADKKEIEKKLRQIEQETERRLSEIDRKIDKK
ncbi:MAG: potassium channel family protein [Victivallaceae bacterium]